MSEKTGEREPSPQMINTLRALIRISEPDPVLAAINGRKCFKFMQFGDIETYDHRLELGFKDFLKAQSR